MGGADDAADVLDFGEGGAADTGGFAVIEVGGAGRWEVDVAALPRGTAATVDNLGGVAHAFRLRLETGTSVAFIARATEGNVDPHVVLKGPARDTIATGRDQAILPMAAEEDSVVTFEAAGGTDYIFVVADKELEAVGHLVIDVVLFAEPLDIDLGWTDVGGRAVAEALREREPELAERLTQGAIVEGVEGYVSVGDVTGVPLRERAGINGLISNIAELRGILYEHYGEERHPAVGRAAAELFWAVRAP